MRIYRRPFSDPNWLCTPCFCKYA